MPKNFIFKKLEGMSILEQVPYRPWCEDPQQEAPVDFSLKGRKTPQASENHTDIRSQLFVRTPDSGFSSPSESEFRKGFRPSSPSRHFGNLYTSGLRAEEQVTPLALVKKKNQTSVYGRKESTSPTPSENVRLSLASDYNLSRHQANAVKLLSSSHFWNNNNNSLVPPFTTLVPSSIDISPGSLLGSPQDTSKTNYLPSTPAKTPPKSPCENSILSPIKRKTPSTSITPEKKSKSLKKTKASRKLNFDEDNTSPVSGTIIRELEEGEEPLVVRKGDIDPAYNVVEVTDEAKAELSKIENKIGEYVCRLCKELYDDAFGLAQHRCSRIIHVEYRCPECDKVFNCPANLASHRRWHKPKGGLSSSGSKMRTESKLDSESKKFYASDISDGPALLSLSEYTELPTVDSGDIFECSACFKKFKKQSYLRKHLSTHHNHESSEELDDNSLSSHHPFSMFSPNSPPQLPPLTPLLSPPLLSPPFSENVFRCRLCSATFFTPAALQLHYTSIHDSDDQPSSSFLSQAMHLPAMPPFCPKNGLLNYSYPLHLNRPSQISAPS